MTPKDNLVYSSIATLSGVLAILIWSLSASIIIFAGDTNPFLYITLSFGVGFLFYLGK